MASEGCESPATLRRRAAHSRWGMLRGVIYTFREYCHHSSLHGLKYLTDERRHPVDKLYWLVAFISGLSLSYFFIVAIWSKWEENPIIVSLDTTAAIINDIPFPAVTICNMNKMKRSAVEKLTLRFRSGERNAHNKQLLRSMKDVIRWRSKTASGSFFSNGSDAAIDALVTQDTTLAPDNLSDEDVTGQNMADFMKQVTPSCRDMLKYCRWDSVVENCESLFQEVTSDDGLCCAFNTLPEALIRRPLSGETDNYTEHWTPEIGYVRENDTFPKRGAAPGVSAGLTLLLDVQMEEYFLPRSGSVGFKVLLHSPTDVPAVKEFGFAVSPGAESFISVRPSQVYSTRQIRSLNQSRRKCYFEEERPLAFFRIYSVSSCVAECLANATQRKCRCREHFMPAANDSVRVCGFLDTINCVKDIGDVISGSSNRKLCDCQPACTELSYSHELSSTRFPTSNDLGTNTLDNLRNAIQHNESFESFVKNHALVHVFLRDYKVMRYKRARMYDILDFTANLGGLLSLCLGFSFLSAAEIIYFACMRCGFLSRRR
ncbi:pickpocket protein 28-like [Neocloeon triangulifer]|uniref:pickpocket protein 28-like n=1 Tax=Neocloeon triangulifer TaxID=2078957 RepID=UPI00286F82A4|nr:pickpocket protein 28-like [Neocloeon triangulifer]